MIDLTFQTCPFDLRDYQDLAVELTIAALKDKHNPVVCLPTGTGKSVVNVELIRQLFVQGLKRDKIRKFLILCPFIEIVDQFKVYTKKFGLQGFVEIQTYAYAVLNYKDSDPKTYFAVLIDECHHTSADELTNVIAHFRAYKVGFSATPDRLDGKPLDPPYTTVIQPHPDQWYEDNGYLAPIEILGKPLADFTIQNLNDDLSYQNKLIDKPQIFGNSFHEWEKHCFGLLTIAYLPGVDSAKHYTQQFNNYFREKFNGRDIAVFMDGTTPKKYRQKVIENFGDLQSKYGYLIIVNVKLFIEGLDCPKAKCCIMLRKTLSRGAYKQMIGRVRRPGAIAFLLDHVGNFLLHNHPNLYIKYDLKGKLKDKKDKSLGESGIVEIPEFCPNCTTEKLIQFTSDLRCLVCGYTFNTKKGKQNRKRGLPEQVEGELQRFKDHPGRLLVQSAIEQWQIEAKGKKWNKGWMVHRVKSAFISYPDMPLELAAMALSFVGYAPTGASIIAQQAQIQAQLMLDRGI
jgi:superfamily II DNA or RNA helicase